jgi:AraC-like DNA-binding protein
MTVEYREWVPVPALSGHIEAIWSLSGGAIPGAGPQRILPDGCSELILNFGDPVEQVRGTDLLRQPRLLFVGQLQGPLFIRPTGRIDQLGIRFRPAGAAGFIREPQSRLIENGLALGDLAPRLARALGRRPFDITDPGRRVAAVQDALVRAVPAGPSPVAAVADRLVRSWGVASVEQLARDAGLSGRQLARRFLADVGLRPKLLARICRFQRVFHALGDGSGPWARVAAECGYYDSSHLIRDFHQLAGEAPARLIDAAPELTRVFTRAQRAADHAA